jgi:hypothetical protein
MQLDTRARFFGIGIVRNDPREAMVRAAELTAAMIRHFATGTILASDFNPLPYLVAADRHMAALSNGDALHLFVLPWPAPIAVPPGYLAAFSASTRKWKRGAAPLTAALDAYVAEFVHQRGWSDIALEPYSFTEQGIHFLHMIMVREAPPAPPAETSTERRPE